MNKLVGAAALAASLLLAAAPHAAAHEGNPNYRSEITQIAPSGAGIEAQVVNFDDSIELANEGGSTVVVMGYEGEPYLRFSPDGLVEVNRRSPAAYLNDDRFGESDVPGEADPEASPRWEAVDTPGPYTWHDHRAHYMSRALPPQVTDEGVVTEIFDYSIPIEVDGRRGALDGTLTWVGKDDSFPIAPFIALGVLTLVGLPLAVLWRRRRDSEGGSPGSGGSGEAW